MKFRAAVMVLGTLLSCVVSAFADVQCFPFDHAWDRGAWETTASVAGDPSAFMTLTNRFDGAVAFCAALQLAPRTAPVLVLTGADRPDDVREIALSDTGISVCRGRRPVETFARLEEPFEPDVAHQLLVSVRPNASPKGKGRIIRVACEGRVLETLDETFPMSFRLGIRGGVGTNRVWCLSVAEKESDIAPTERIRPWRGIRVNQVGYACGSPKVAEVVASVAEKFATFRVQHLGPSLVWKDVYEGRLSPIRGGFADADFSSVTTPGDYRVICGEMPAGGGTLPDKPGAYSSFTFQIRDGVYGPLERTLFGFYTWQRCGSKKGWAGECHRDRVPLVGTDRTLDMSGGYHQSSDLRCWADDTARAVWLLHLWAEESHPVWDDGIVEEELRWGAEYFAKLVGPEGWAYDCQFEPLGWGPRNYYVTSAPMNAQVCVLHVLARAARRFRASDPAFARTCEEKAKSVFRHLETHPAFAKPYELPPQLKTIPPGSQPPSFYRNSFRGNPNGDAAFASAAIELYEATGEEAYRERAKAYGEKVLKTFADVKYVGSCGTGSFLRFAPLRLWKLTEDARYRDLVKGQCEEFLAWSTNLQANASTIKPSECGLVLLEGARLFGDARYRVAAQRCLDWMLGVNRHSTSFVNGVGMNQQMVQVWGQFFPSTPWIPGAITHAVGGEYNLPNAGALMLLAARLERDDGFPIPERHRPKLVMGKDYWTLLSSFWYSDPEFVKYGMKMPEWMDNSELIAKPVFRDCAIVYSGGKNCPDPDKGKATYRTLAEYFAPEDQYKQMEKCPKADKPMFVSVNGMRGYWQSIYTGEIDLDYADYAAWKARHPNFQGFYTAVEWENDLWLAWWNCTIYKKRWPYSDASREALKTFLSPWPTNRYQHAALQKKALERKFALHFGERVKSAAMRAGGAIDHLAGAWGVKYLLLETTATSSVPQEYRWGIQPMFTRGAARQFGVPWGWYVAQFLNGYRKDGTWQNDSCASYCWTDKKTPQGGISPSLNRRAFYFAYLSGANTVEQEGWYATFLQGNKATKKACFSVRGQAFSDYHDFTVAHPDRGTPYTPVAILVPFEQGYPACGGLSWGCYAYTPGDQTVDAVFFTLNPGYDREAFVKKGGEANLHNSKYALMYDVVCPDAPQDPAELLKVLKSYQAVVLTGDYRDRSFEKTLARYEREGGRVLRVDPKALPSFADGREAVKEIQTGKRSFPSVAKILDGLQADYFPFKVKGDVMYGANRTEKGWWLWVFNNKGVTKFTDQFEEIDPSAAAKVSVDMCTQAACPVVELITGRNVVVKDGRFDFTIPAGDLAVFEISRELL